MPAPSAPASAAAVLERAIAMRTLPDRRRPLPWDLAPPARLPALGAGTWAQHVAVARRGDPDARATLVERYAPAARSRARMAFRHREPLEDLVQVALEALLLAIDRFDPERRTPFLGFANPTIDGTLKRHFRDTGWGVHVSRSVHDLTGPVRDAAELLHADLGRRPTSDEIADLLDVDPARVDEALVAGSARLVESLDGMRADDDRNDALAAMGVVSRGFDEVVDRIDLRAALATLDRNERNLVDQYYMQGRTQSQLAAELGVSQMSISRRLARSVAQLRTALAGA